MKCRSITQPRVILIALQALPTTPSIVDPDDRGRGSGMKELARKAASHVQETYLFVVVLSPFLMREKGAV